MNKKYRILLYLMVCMALLLATTQAFASPSSQQGNNPPRTKTPGAQATEKAIENAAKDADKPAKGKHENFKGTVSAADANSITLILRDDSSVTVSLNSDTRIKFPGPKNSAPDGIQPGMNAPALGGRLGCGTPMLTIAIASLRRPLLLPTLVALSALLGPRDPRRRRKTPTSR